MNTKQKLLYNQNNSTNGNKIAFELFLENYNNILVKFNKLCIIERQIQIG